MTNVTESNNIVNGGHVVTFGEIRLDGTKAILTNDSGDFTVEFNDGPSTFTLTFERNISKAVFSLTPFDSRAGAHPFLTLQGAREGTHVLDVGISNSGKGSEITGSGFWIMITYLTMCAE